MLFVVGVKAQAVSSFPLPQEVFFNWDYYWFSDLFQDAESISIVVIADFTQQSVAVPSPNLVCCAMIDDHISKYDQRVKKSFADRLIVFRELATVGSCLEALLPNDSLGAQIVVLLCILESFLKLYAIEKDDSGSSGVFDSSVS